MEDVDIGELEIILKSSLPYRLNWQAIEEVSRELFAREVPGEVVEFFLSVLA